MICPNYQLTIFLEFCFDKFPIITFQGLGVSMSSSGTTTPRERLDSEDIKVCIEVVLHSL
jgi:hypothetical protein